MNLSQRAMAVVHYDPTLDNDTLAVMADSSEMTIRRARFVDKYGTQAEKDLVLEGEISVSTAQDRIKARLKKCSPQKTIIKKPVRESEEKTRVCKICGIEQPIDNFYVLSGYRIRTCKKCRNARTVSTDIKGRSFDLDMRVSEKDVLKDLHNVSKAMKYSIKDFADEMSVNIDTWIGCVETMFTIHEDILNEYGGIECANKELDKFIGKLNDLKEKINGKHNI